MNQQQTTCRYFVSYSGIKLPLKLVNDITEDGLHNRNTYFCGHFNSDGQLVFCQKIVYGEVESEHVYYYHDNGALKLAQITEDDETRAVSFQTDTL